MKKIISFVVIGLFSIVALAQPKYEVRAVWLTTNGGLDWPKGETSISQQKSNLCEILDKLEDANFNTIIFQAQVKGDVAWISTKQPAMNAFTGNGAMGLSYDVSQFVIDECHKRNMECHAWIVPYRVGTQKEANKYKDNNVKHVTVSHPELCVLYNGAYYLDPGIPATREYLLDVYKELISNYDFDGVNFDYTRYPGSDFDDAESYQLYNPEYLPKDDWRRENINTFIAEFYEMAKGINPDIKVGAAPIGTYQNVPGYGNMTAYGSVYQDACQWMQSGNHDLLIPQMYWNENYGFSPNMQTWVTHSAGRQLVVGLAPYKMVDSNNWDVSVITDQIEKVRKQEGMSGLCFFRTDHVIDVAQTKIASLYNQLQDNYFKYPAHIVPMEYNWETTPNAPRNVKQVRDGWNYTITWDNPYPDTENTPIRYYNIYFTNRGLVDVTDLQTVAAFKVNGNKFTYSSMDNSLTFAVTAFDKNYYESQPALSDVASLEDVESASCKVYYNNDMIYVSGIKNINRVEVYSVMGNCVISQQINATDATVSCDLLTDGLYIINAVYDDGNNVVNKFIK